MRGKGDNIPWAIMAMFLMFSVGIKVPLASAISEKTFGEEEKDRVALYRGLAQALHALDQTRDLSIRGRPTQRIFATRAADASVM